MGKVISFDRADADQELRGADCPHKHVIANTGKRTVRCVLCGSLLDPFDVLVDIIARAEPPYVRDPLIEEVPHGKKNNDEE
jgi:hypothetical protein